MKKELPPAAIWGAVAIGILVLVGIFFMAGGSNAPTAQDRKEWAEQAEVAKGRSQAYSQGMSGPGQGSGEAAARQQAAQGGN